MTPSGSPWPKNKAGVNRYKAEPGSGILIRSSYQTKVGRDSIQTALHYTREDCRKQLGARAQVRSMLAGTCYNQYLEILDVLETLRWLWPLHGDD